ncbi:NAD-dependent epimerase/dehydratase family protein [Microlunatus capsulatus]|uniref:Nucleoside-diphosphate-sugar epimerase n=1 Tax=Microlunatus capsulatus TaxID=99117 RepID=A0ABS4Z7U1_9ACTN|nr:NAD-dependent epimerase/dehydratase family protein [Microlunatus capsulatus]MBP2417123.1 nucleoside-diphosphate-sugar epimerase [Microlunatus capsulatus]
MNIFLTGGTGYIGSALLPRLVERGHQVTAAVRSEASAEKVSGLGATPVTGDLTDATWVAAQLARVDGAVHTASPGDASSPDFDAAVATAAVQAFAGTEKPYVHTSGLWIWGAGEGLSEQSPLNPPALTAWRPGVEDIVLGAGLRGGIVAPAVVHGHGGGLPNVLLRGPRTADGALILIGDGSQHWGTVHVDDLADLYVLVLERGEVLGRVLGVTAGAPTVRAVAEATGDPVAPEPVEATRARLGEAFADALLLDQQFDNGYALSLGWSPRRSRVVDEVRAGDYAG